eukprot:scaffold22835_cov21-Tisochrysis_lutea.AAC.1
MLLPRSCQLPQLAPPCVWSGRMSTGWLQVPLVSSVSGPAVCLGPQHSNENKVEENPVSEV